MIDFTDFHCNLSIFHLEPLSQPYELHNNAAGRVRVRSTSSVPKSPASESSLEFRSAEIVWCRRHHRNEQGESENAHDKFHRREVVILVNGHLM